VEASSTPTIRRLTPSCRHQLSLIALSGQPGGTVVTAVTPTMSSALTNVTANQGAVPFLTNATLNPATGTAVTSVTAPTTPITAIDGSSTATTPFNPNLRVPAVDASIPNNAPPAARFAFQANGNTTTNNNGSIVFTNTNNPGQIGPLQTVPFLNGSTVTTPVVTGVTAPQQNNFLTSGTSVTTQASNAITSVTPSSAQFVNGLNVSTAPLLTDVTPTTTPVVNSVAVSNSGPSDASSLGCGVSAVANGTNSVELGNNTAAGTNSVALGQGAQALGMGSTAIGQGAMANGTNSVEVGNNAAAGTNSVALGQSAQALGVGSTAIGQGASTGSFNNAMAIGNGAVATRDNQVVIGTASNTYTTPGITSAASRAAQSGPVEVVTTDAKGNLASDGGAIFSNINILNSQIARINQNLDQLNNDVKRLDGGVAMAMALGGVYLPEHQTFALHTDVGFYNGAQAIAVQAIARINRTFTANGGVAYDLNGRAGVGGRVGLSAGW
jgi:trimeric autotransporter adhesin